MIKRRGRFVSRVLMMASIGMLVVFNLQISPVSAESTVKITYHANYPEGSTTTNEEEYVNGTQIKTVNDLQYSADGYVFAGWKDDDGNIYKGKNNFKLNLSNDIHLYALWETSYTVNYTWNEVSISYNNGATYSVVKSANDTYDIKDSYDLGFKHTDGKLIYGWKDDGSAMDLQWRSYGSAFKTICATDFIYGNVMTLKEYGIAFYDIVQVGYLMFFHENIGTNNRIEHTVDEGNILVLPTANSFDFSNGDKVFIGWNTKSDGSGVSLKANDSIDDLGAFYDLYHQGGIMHFYAQWKDATDEQTKEPTIEETIEKPNLETDINVHTIVEQAKNQQATIKGQPQTGDESTMLLPLLFITLCVLVSMILVKEKQRN